MRTKISAVIIFLAILSGIITLFFLSCDKKEIKAPVVGPAAGSGPVGGGDAQKISLLASPSETITVSVNEQATVKITALIENNIGQPMPDGTAVYWTTEIGSLDSTVTTSSNGSSTVTLTFPKGHNGCTWVVARSGDVEGGIRLCVTSTAPTATPTTAPTATPGPATPAPTATPARTIVILNPTPPTYTHSCPTGAEGLNITVLVQNGGIPENGTPVTFAVYGSTTALLPLPTTPINTNSAGIATYPFTGCTTPATTETVTIVASTGGITANLVVTVTP